MNAYDFDQTIYDGDATVDFFMHCVRRHSGVRRFLPSLIGPGIRFLLGKLDKTQWKQVFFGFLARVPEVELEVLLFWDRHDQDIKQLYLSRKRPDDLIISASPEFLLRPICQRMGVKSLIASRVDRLTGKYSGLNCHGDEKLRRLLAEMPGVQIDTFYSDSPSDAPLASIARRALLVKGNKLYEWRP